MGEQLVLQGALAAPKVIDGIEMGVLEDGTPYFTGRAVAALCGVAISTVIEQKAAWAAGKRDGKFARLLASTGFDEDELAVAIGLDGGKRFDAYTERVVMAFLEYYAFELEKPEALRNFRALARAGFRLFVYTALGYDPAKSVPLPWREFHDRMQLHSTPSGYFSVFKEMADFILAAIRHGMRIDHRTVPDISVGQAWAKHWNDNNLEAKYGPRIKHPHNYPDYFPQSESNPQPMNVYPVEALGEFRRWMDKTYIPDGQIAKGTLPPSTAEILLTAVQPMDPKMLTAPAGGDEK